MMDVKNQKAFFCLRRKIIKTLDRKRPFDSSHDKENCPRRKEVIMHKTGASRRNVPLASSLCCCSLKLKDTGLVARFYSTQGYQDGTKTKDAIGRQSLRSMDTSERETLRQRLNTFARQERRSSSIRRFEPCYRQIYPSKKRKATFKIPKKPPYIPAVHLKKTTSYRDKYDKIDLKPVKGRRLQWPPLYPSKIKNYPQPKKPEDRSQELPSWLLPLYSCKTSNNKDVPSTSEARFSGRAFHRKMEIVESIKQIRANQDVLLGRFHEKDTKKDESIQLSTSKSANAVDTLKRKISSMHDYLSAVRNMEVYRKRYQTQKLARETELTEEKPVPVKQAYTRIYQTKPPTLAQEVRVRKSTGLGILGPKPLAKSDDVTVDNTKDINDKRILSPKKQYEESVAMNPEANIKTSKAVDQRPDGEGINNLSLGQIHKESVVMIKQPSWKKHHISKSQEVNEPVTGEKKTPNSQTNIEFMANQIRVSPKQHQRETINDTSMKNLQSRSDKIQDINAVDGSKLADAWTVESLKSRINVMKIKNTLDEPGTEKLEKMTLTRNGGEVNPKISQVALRSFHKEAGSKNPKKITVANTNKPQLGYHIRTMSRRNFSTFRPLASEQPSMRDLGCHRRTIFNGPQNKHKRRSWVSRLKRCFVLKKIKGSKCENWKEAPREIPYASKEVKYNSPAPILWKPSELVSCLEQQSKPAESTYREKVNPAVLNAEQRVLASISRLISKKTQPDVPDVRIVDVENKIKRAKHKVNIEPWLKRSKSTGVVQTLPQLRSSYNRQEKYEPQESGYEWILRNKDMVEELKRQSRYASGKSLVPTEVKNAINQYKLPLKGEISQFRRKMDQKFSEQLYMYSTSKRWYSSCFAGRQRQILSCSDVILVNTRGIKTMQSQKENVIPSKYLDRRTRLDIELGPNLRHYNQGVSNKRRKIEETNENPAEEKQPNRWAWKIPNKTRAFTPKATTLTSPSKAMGTRMSEMSPCALKKQVEELKCLIKKAREEGTEKTEEIPIDPQSDDKYEARLKRLVKAAHNNAQKMQIVGPTYTSENNMIVNKPSKGKRNSSKPIIQYNTKPDQPKNVSEVSVLKSLFRKNQGESKTLADEILHRNNLTSLPPLASKKPEKSISLVYLKLKSLVEAVRNKPAMMHPISDVKLLPSKSLDRSVSVNARLPLLKSSKEENSNLGNAAKSGNASKYISPATVGLVAQRTPAPSNTIQLWKGESKPNEFQNDKEPTHRDLLTLFTKAKGLFYYHPTEDGTVTGGKSPTTEVDKNSNTVVSNDTLSNNEITQNWLSIKENTSNTPTAVLELKNDPKREDFKANLHLLSKQQNDSGVDILSEYMMTKSRMIPFDFLKTESKITCDHMWTSVPVKVQDDEDLYRKSSLEINSTDGELSASRPKVELTSLPEGEGVCSKTVNDNLANQTKLWQPGSKTEQNESQNPKPIKQLLQKRMIKLGSLTNNLGSGVGSLLEKFAGSSKNGETDDTMSNKPEHHNLDLAPKTGSVMNSPGELSNSLHSQDNYEQYPSTWGETVTSSCSKVADSTHKVLSQQNTTITNSIEEQANQPEIKDQYAQDCIESLGPLEQKVKEYDNYYRNHFSEDAVSGYEHLQQVYDGLIKVNINTIGQYQSLENPNKIEMEKGKEASSELIGQTSEEPTNTPIEMVSKNIDSNARESAEFLLDVQAAKTKQDGTINQHDVNVVTSVTQVSSLVGEVPETSSNNEGSAICWKHGTNIPANAIVDGGRLSEPQRSDGQVTLNADSDGERQRFKPTDVTYNTERFIDNSGNICEAIHFQESDPVQMGHSNLKIDSTQESMDFQSQFSSVNKKKEEPANFEELLTQDPTLNPEVVKNLKLPVILPEDRHTEKNWYTRFFSGPPRNH